MHGIYLKIKICLEGESSPNIGRANHNIGEAYRQLELYDKAEVHLNKALQSRKEHFGEDSVDYADTLNSIANINRNMKRYSLALEQYQTVLRTYKKHNHKQGVATVLNNIAIVH
jgi:tetratricopeptide (TPR) repeat protein